MALPVSVDAFTVPLGQGLASARKAATSLLDLIGGSQIAGYGPGGGGRKIDGKEK